ncbi:MAG TPA: hypothetical protein DG754_06865, partial [Bacteroidales bacterium]|nr:hypothetical protein [Bacteroidales bacterium]
NAKVGVTTNQADAIAANTEKVGITVQQASDITANNAKVSITTQQASDITANNAKVGITTVQTNAIAANTAKISYPAADKIKLNGIEVGAQANVKADWNATAGDALILNKPTIPAAADGSETKVTAGNNVSVTGTGTTGNPYVINSTDGVMPFAEFYALMPGDNTATVAVGAAIEFPQNGPSSGITRLSTTGFILPDIGTYMVSWQVSIDEAGQLALALDGTEITRTTVGRAALTSQITGNSLITTTSVNSTLSVVNPLGNSTALTITQNAGGANPVSASLVIMRVQ